MLIELKTSEELFHFLFWSVFFPLLNRKIWGITCFNTTAYFRSNLLCSVCLCRYVYLRARITWSFLIYTLVCMSLTIVLSYCLGLCWYISYMRSLCRARVSPILQPQQFQNKVHFRILPLHGSFCVSILQRVPLGHWSHSCSHPFTCRMLSHHFLLINITYSIFLKYFWSIQRCQSDCVTLYSSSTACCKWYSLPRQRLQAWLHSSWT